MKSPTSLIEKELDNLGKYLLANFVYETTPYFITKDGKIIEQGCKWKTEEAETTNKRIQERIKEINTQVTK